MGELIGNDWPDVLSEAMKVVLGRARREALDEAAEEAERVGKAYDTGRGLDIAGTIAQRIRDL